MRLERCKGSSSAPVSNLAGALAKRSAMTIATRSAGQKREETGAGRLLKTGCRGAGRFGGASCAYGVVGSEPGPQNQPNANPDRPS